ncbi:kinase-like domain-containing protein [Microdochium trichocladiopsis]|uniref:non-specific serine/threonine protein kinase n=1 Tax=Microdochium trichocladiopsis TaxID=1682393 RepID=A0A9P8XXX3_9PEZI|nr:kinase-like domain-containing protein [Microdochium trichocladiopsis]KAH7018478.1 kinase-like domain-containing protein [Microdochium trichocladiopsis]
MELIPYESREGRQIVLRHRNALVVRDQGSHRLQVRGLAVPECPTCRRPLRSPSPERHFDGGRAASHQHDSFVDPDYFRMLQAGYAVDVDDRPQAAPSSPVRRLTQPTLPSNLASTLGNSRSSIDNAEFVSSSPAPQEGARIRRDAFSPNYFQRFFVEEQELGRGGKGVVLLVRHEIDGCQLGHFACKRVPVGDDHAWLEKVLVEVELLAKLSHPNLVSYRHVWLEDVKLNRFGPSVACAFILQQYCNAGDLLKYIVGEQPKLSTKEQLKAQLRRRSKGSAELPDPLLPSLRRLPFDEIFSLFRDIVSGLAYLHGANYVHRDLKPSNCLLHLENGKMTCLISDFGEVQQSGAIRNSTGTTGTISYCAPEVLQPGADGRLGNFTAKSDVFSLGMILYFLCFGHLPYSNANTVNEELEDVDLLRAEIQSWRGFQDGVRQRGDLPAKLYHLLRQMLSVDPAARPTAADVLGAMNHESNGFSGFGRSADPVPDLQHRRVQNLDSPMPPGTPVPDPSKARKRNSVEGGAKVKTDPFTDASSSLSMAISRSQDSRFGRGSTAPVGSSTAVNSHEAANDGKAGSIISRSPPPYLASSSQPPLPRSPPPLLPPPPPSTNWGILKQRMHYAYETNAEFLFLFTRLALFVLKIATLSRACFPYALSSEVNLPLLGLAALDLALPSYLESQHYVLSSASIAGPHGVVQRHNGAFGRLLPSTWTWRSSLSLVALHFGTLWAVARHGGLCAATDTDDYWDLG